MKILAIYDNGGKTLDRYTIVTDTKRKEHPKQKRCYIYTAISASENGLGVFMWVECIIGHHLGKKIEFDTLSKELQDKINFALS